MEYREDLEPQENSQMPSCTEDEQAPRQPAAPQQPVAPQQPQPYGYRPQTTATPHPGYGYYTCGQSAYYNGQSGYAPFPPRPTAAQEQPGMKKGSGLRILAGVLAAVLLCAVTCVATAVAVKWICREENEDLRHQMAEMSQLLEDQMLSSEQKLAVMRQELDKAQDLVPSGQVPQEGMTPAQIYAQCAGSVVAITNQAAGSGGAMVTIGTGSGFVLSEDGYVVSNHHVVEGAQKLLVTLSDGTQLEAQLIGSDNINDIALLKVVPAEKLIPVTLGSSDALHIGDQVVAIGNPLGDLTATATVGYISGKDRPVTTDGVTIDMLQTDAAINSGNSGGPLFNVYGQVVGITTAKYSGTTGSGASIEGIGFAIPMDDVLGMLEDLRLHGYITGGYLGVEVSSMDPQIAGLYNLPVGAYVRKVTEDSCAQKAGIQVEDIITNLGGYDVENLTDLTRALRNFKAGERVSIQVYRGGATVTLSAVLDEKPRP